MVSRPCLICTCLFYCVSSFISSSAPLRTVILLSPVVSLLFLAIKTFAHSRHCLEHCFSLYFNYSSSHRFCMKHNLPGKSSLASAWPRTSCQPRTLPHCAHQGGVFLSVLVNIGLKFIPYPTFYCSLRSWRQSLGLVLLTGVSPKHSTVRRESVFNQHLLTWFLG